MPRRARIDAAGALYHIVIRGIECEAIFKERTRRILSRGSRICCRRWMRMRTAGIDLSAVIAAVCSYLGIEAKGLTRPTIRVEIAHARSLVSYPHSCINNIVKDS